MRGRLGWAAFGCLLLLLLGACGGGGGPKAVPASGAEVCDKLKEAERFRYSFNYILESEQQENPPDDSTGGDYVLKPSQADFRLNIKHSGAAERPDRLDFEISLPDQPAQAGVRTIRIGESQWHSIGGSWQSAPPEASVFPFTPPNVCDVIVSPLELRGQAANAERIGETATRHVRVNGASLSAAAQLFGPASDMGRLLTSYDVDIWLGENDRPVKIEAVSSATYPYGRVLSVTIVMDIGSYDDGDIKIQAPI
jgi:hypothetical protein